MGITHLYLDDMTINIEQVNGQWGIVIRMTDGKPFNVVLMDMYDGKVQCIYSIAGEHKLTGLVV